MQFERKPAQPKPRGKSRQRVVQEQRRFKPVVVVSSVLLLLLTSFAVLTMLAFSSDTLLATRNFYGVLRVWEINADKPKLRAFELTHGKTVHGFQFDAGILRVLPTTYYSESSGVGLSILNHPARPGNLRIGALGLGVGVIAAYGEPGDVFQFYEINPDVIRIAQGEGGYFSFLTDSRATIHVIPGDARLSLEHELVSEGSQNFDLMVLDAFSGDALPLHLLTKQAFEIYLKHLKPDGIMAINVSNRYFNLDQEIYRLADEFDLDAVLIEDVGDSVQSFDSAWMLLTRNRDFLNRPAIASRGSPRPPLTSVPVWTDDYSNLLQILK